MSALFLLIFALITSNVQAKELERVQWQETLPGPIHHLANLQFQIHYQIVWSPDPEPEPIGLLIQSNPELCQWVETNLVNPDSSDKLYRPQDMCLTYVAQQIYSLDPEVGSWLGPQIDGQIKYYTSYNRPPFASWFRGEYMQMCTIFEYQLPDGSYTGELGRDTDGDCRLDRNDQCPNDPAWRSWSGCSDEAPQEVDLGPEYQFSGPEVVAITRPESKTSASLALGFFSSVGSHGNGLDAREGSNNQGINGQPVQPIFKPQKGSQVGFRALISGRYQRSWSRLYFVWGYDRSMPTDEEICMGGGTSFGYSLTQGHELRAWLSGEYNVRGVFLDQDGYFYNNFKGPAGALSLDLRWFNSPGLEGHLEAGGAYSALGIYANGQTTASWFFLAVSLEAKPWW